jgi:Family of unknown function (DUF5691)
VSRWQDLVTASLIGTERAVVPRVEIPGLPPARDAAPDSPFPEFPVLDSTGADAAAVLLDRAAVLTAARRAGRQPGHAAPPAAAGPDPGPAVSPAAGRRLARMLGGEHQDLLAEWLAVAAARGLRAPAPLLPALLDRAVRPPPGTFRLRRLVAEVGGSRARWLAGLNPDWQFVLAGTPGDWRAATIAERRRYLTALRARDAGAARDLIAGGWDRAGQGERAMYLSVLAERPDPADEPLLEAALDDRAPEVRAEAASLLARLPGSALGARMAGRAVGCVCLEHGGRGPHLKVVPPAESGPSMWRDGLPRRPAGTGPQPLVAEVVARTPLRTWTEEFGLPAARIVTIPAGDWTPVLLHGWSRAAIAQDDKEWMTALIRRLLAGHATGRLENAALRHLARRADPGPDDPPRPGPDAPAAVQDAFRLLRFRYEMLKELEDDHGDG